jgi:hypothetical protein
MRLGVLDYKKSRPTATIYIGKPPHFEEAICDVGIFEQTAARLPQKFAARC